MSVLKELKTPSFFIEGKPQIDVTDYALTVDGLVVSGMKFAYDQLLAMKKIVVNARLTSVSGWSVRADWGGALFSDFLKEVELKPEASHVIFASAGGYETCVAIDDLKYHPRVLVCWEAGGEPLEPEYGAPVRMFIPHLWGYKSCKSMVRMTFTARMYGGYWEDRGYPRTASIQPGDTFDINSRDRMEIPGGEVDTF